MDIHALLSTRDPTRLVHLVFFFHFVLLFQSRGCRQVAVAQIAQLRLQQDVCLLFLFNLALQSGLVAQHLIELLLQRIGQLTIGKCVSAFSRQHLPTVASVCLHVPFLLHVPTHSPIGPFLDSRYPIAS